MAPPTGLTLAVRPAGSEHWVHIDPSTPRGRRLAASFGFTTTKENIAMSAIPVDDVHVVQNNLEQAGLLISMRANFKAAWNWLKKAPGTSWEWLCKTFHLDPTVKFFQGCFNWLRDKLAIAAAHMGISGGIGAGLFTISTSAGRKLLAFVLKPLTWIASGVMKAWTWVEDGLFVEKAKGQHLNWLDKARNWVSEKMATVREFFFGNGTSLGVVGKTMLWLGKNVMPFFGLDHPVMQTSRVVGFGLLAFKAVTALALLPFAAGTIMALQFIAGAAAIGVGATMAWDIGNDWAVRLGWKAAPVTPLTVVPVEVEVEIVVDATAAAEGVTVTPSVDTTNRTTRRATTPPAKRRRASTRK